MKVKFGKYKGQDFTEVPKEYAEWHKWNGSKKFYTDWHKAHEKVALKNRLNKKDSEQLSLTKPNAGGNYIFCVNLHVTSRAARIGKRNILYYMVDSNGNYLRDLKVIGDNNAKVGAVDTDSFSDGWVTCSPSGRMIKGKMLVRPYEQHGFNYTTYQLSKEQIEVSRIPIK